MTGKHKIHRAARDAALAELRAIVRELPNGERLPRQTLEFYARRAGYSAHHLHRLLTANSAPSSPSFRLDDHVVETLHLRNGCLEATYRQLERENAPNLPSLSTFKRRVKRHLGGSLHTARKGVAGIRQNRIVLPSEKHAAGTHYLLDHTELPIWVVPDGHRRVVRPWATAVMDHETRYVCAMVITFGIPGANEVVAAVGSAVHGRLAPDDETVVGGLPLSMAWDQGKEFLSDHVTQTCLRLGVQGWALPAYSPHLKGRLERFWKFFKADALGPLPGYVEKTGQVDLAGKPVNASQAMSQAEFLIKLTEWLDWYHVQHVNREMGCTPLNAWKGRPDAVERVAPEHLWFALLKHDKSARVTREGVSWRGLHYIDPENSQAFNDLIGQSVEIRYWPDRPEFIELFHAGTWVCTAIPSNLLTPANLSLFLSRRREQKKLLQDGLRASTRLRMSTDGAVRTQEIPGRGKNKDRQGRRQVVLAPEEPDLLAPGIDDFEELIGRQQLDNGATQEELNLWQDK